MSDKLRDLQIEGAERRVRHDLERLEPDKRLPARRRVIVLVAAFLFAATFALRLLIDDPSALVANFYAVPIALVAVVAPGLRVLMDKQRGVPADVVDAAVGDHRTLH